MNQKSISYTKKEADVDNDLLRDRYIVLADSQVKNKDFGDACQSLEEALLLQTK